MGDMFWKSPKEMASMSNAIDMNISGRKQGVTLTLNWSNEA